MKTVFRPVNIDYLKQPMFFGESVNVARYDQQTEPRFEAYIEKQLSFFWRPEEVDVSQDRADYQSLSDHERHIFTSNLKYQILLDSIQGRSPNLALLPIVSLPELETWIETWSFSETIHSRSYTHIIRNIVNNPSEIFDDIAVNEHIIKRAKAVTSCIDEMIEVCESPNAYSEEYCNKKLIETLVVMNALEGLRFYVSFACSFAFAERALMEGNAKIIKLIARDEALHLASTQTMLERIRTGKEGAKLQEAWNEMVPRIYEVYEEVRTQEKEWAEYLFKDGSMIGLNKDILSSYIDYLTNICLGNIGLEAMTEVTNNPLPWINSWFYSENVQVAPQESEISSYLVGQVDSSVEDDDFGDMTL